MRTFPNVASLPSTGGQNGEAVMVTSLKAPWTYVTDGVVLAVDHITVESTADGGSSRWVREAPLPGVWEAIDSFIYIDGVSGDLRCAYSCALIDSMHDTR